MRYRTQRRVRSPAPSISQRLSIISMGAAVIPRHGAPFALWQQQQACCWHCGFMILQRGKAQNPFTGGFCRNSLEKRSGLTAVSAGSFSQGRFKLENKQKKNCKLGDGMTVVTASCLY